ncbi:MAG: histidine kinase, partial [Merismopedia sp. SIO2A8]|nr:histidine kinase [Merismopedia sp. SIO2A8]
MLQRFYNLPIRNKQLLGLFTSEVISILGLVGVGALLIVSSGQSQLRNQAKSELVVTQLNYNTKIDQMGFGFRGQSDNFAIIAAANQGDALTPDLKQKVKKILQNEIKAREIEYATLVDRNGNIIVNANAN